jgi:hypothetical protein
MHLCIGFFDKEKMEILVCCQTINDVFFLMAFQVFEDGVTHRGQLKTLA